MIFEKTVFHWWWAWSSERLEHYLERMQLSGWELSSTAIGHTLFHFSQVEPCKVRYCLDYQQKVSDEYYSIMTDDGWKMIGNSTGWIIWSKPYESERPELYTDKQSLIDRNKRLLGLCIFLLATQVPAIMNLFNLLTSKHETISNFLLFVIVSTQGLLWYGIIRLLLYNRHLRNGDG